MDSYVKAIADKTRLKIAFLLTFGELCICDLQEILKLPQTTISRHMLYMKTHNWVSDEKRGRWIYYKLKPAENPFHASLIKSIAQVLRDDPAFQMLVIAMQDHKVNKNCE
jgi:ArsR family transcriptional regulator, arsenate/arsenite/antimonite-responsive transcriptional repressor